MGSQSPSLTLPPTQCQHYNTYRNSSSPAPSQEHNMLTTGQATVLLLCLTLAIGGCRDIRGSGSLSERNKRSLDQFRLCGNQLVNMLTIICRVYALSNRGNEKYHGGRSFSFSDVEMKNSVRHKRGISGTTRRHRVRGSQGLPGGLATTCCQSSCSMAQLMAAC